VSKASRTLGVQWVLPGKKRPFTHTTVATSDLIAIFAEEGFTFAGARNAINYDHDALAVLDRFVAEGYGNHLMSDVGVR